MLKKVHKEPLEVGDSVRVKDGFEDPDNPGEIVLRPMMYLALSYDHRIVDGEQAVKFLVHITNDDLFPLPNHSHDFPLGGAKRG